MRSVCVVIPCYNEEAVLPQLFERLTKAAEGWEVSWNVLCVDDGSRDGTWSLLQAQSQKDPRWQAVQLSRNFGHQPAVAAGLEFAQGDAVVVMDADMQDPPEVVGQFIKKWQEGYDVVYAIRTKRKDSLFRRAAYWGFYRLISKLVDFNLPLDTGDFCIMDRKVVETLKKMPERTRYIRGLRAWAGFRQTGLSYERGVRAAGTTKYNIAKMMKLASNGIFSFSTVPLKTVSALGLWISLLAFAGIIFTLLQKIFREPFADWGLTPVPGYATIVMSVLFIGGVQLVCLGVIGEYIGRIYDEVKGRPTYIIAQRTQPTTAGFGR